MPRPSPARYLAPVALAAFVAIALGIVLASGGGSSTATTSTGPVAHGHRRALARLWVVHTGDSLSRVASRTGVSVSRLEQLNPHLTPNTLRVGQRLRLVG